MRCLFLLALASVPRPALTRVPVRWLLFLVLASVAQPVRCQVLAPPPALLSLPAQEDAREPRGGRVDLWWFFGFSSGKVPKVYQSLPAPGVGRFPLFGYNSALTVSIEPEYVSGRVSVSGAVPIALAALQAKGGNDTLSSLFDEGSFKFFRLGDAVLNLAYSPLVSRRSGVRLDLQVGRDFGTSQHISVGDGIAATTFGLTASKALGQTRLLYAYGRHDALEGAGKDSNLYGIGLTRVSTRPVKPTALTFEASLYDAPGGTDVRVALGHALLSSKLRPNSQVALQVLGLAHSDPVVLVHNRVRGP
jgi:hypothetical protein